MRRAGPILGLTMLAGAAAGQGLPYATEIWDVQLGVPAAEVPDKDFIAISCGTDGGPPSLALDGFADFARCRPEPNGLFEVYFEYDDELEYWARANEYLTEIERYSGTKVNGFPVILSVLIDPAGTVAGYRIVSDPRVETAARRQAAILRTHLMGRFGSDGWACEDRPPREGYRPVGRIYIDQRCTKQDSDGSTLVLETHHFRKPGQEAIDPRTGQPQPGLLESSTRLDVYRADITAAGN